MTTLCKKIEKIESWKRKLENKNSPVRISLSDRRLAFVSVNTETSGRYSEILEIEKFDEENLENEIKISVEYIEKIAKKYMSKTGEKNV